jgi:hypothetical protein
VSDIATLSTFTVNGVSALDSGTAVYVPSVTESVTVVATPTNPDATVAISGDTNIQDGTNTVIVIVTATDGTSTRTYSTSAIRIPTANVGGAGDVITDKKFGYCGDATTDPMKNFDPSMVIGSTVYGGVGNAGHGAYSRLCWYNLDGTYIGSVGFTTDKMISGITYDGSSIWLATSSNNCCSSDNIPAIESAIGTVIKFNPTSKTVSSEYSLGAGVAAFCYDIEFFNETIWVACRAPWVSGREYQFVRINPSTGSVLSATTISSNSIPYLSAYDGSYVWSIGGQNGIFKVDPSTGTKISTIRPTFSYMELISDGTNLWASRYGGGIDANFRVEKISIASGSIVSFFNLPTLDSGSSLRSYGMYKDGNSFWISSEQTVQRQYSWDPGVDKPYRLAYLTKYNMLTEQIEVHKTLSSICEYSPRIISNTANVLYTVCMEIQYAVEVDQPVNKRMLVSLNRAGGPTIPSKNIAPTSAGATVSASVNPEGLLTNTAFEYGTDSNLSTYKTVYGTQFSGNTAQTSTSTITNLPEGATYYYRAVAVNSRGTVRSAIGTFISTSRPVIDTQSVVMAEDPILTFRATVNPGQLQTDLVLTYGTASDLTGANSVTLDWNDSFGSSSVTKSKRVIGLLENQLYYYRFTATNALGTTSSTISSVLTRQPVGVSINGGLQYTDTSTVNLILNAPNGATGALVSNDGGFSNQTQVALGAPVSWRLPVIEDEILPRTVYVKFILSDGSRSQNYTDDVILDTRPPSIVNSSFAVDSGSFVITTSAADFNSGVSTIEISDSSTTVSRPFSATVTVAQGDIPTTSVRASNVKWLRAGGSTKIFNVSGGDLRVRLRDNAGNYTPWTTSSRVALSARSLTPIFTSPTSASGGFTVKVLNYDARFNFSYSVSSGSVSAGTPSNGQVLLTVSGVASGASATVTAVVSQTNYTTTTTTVSGTSSVETSAPAPSAPAPSVGGGGGGGGVGTTWFNLFVSNPDDPTQAYQGEACAIFVHKLKEGDKNLGPVCATKSGSLDFEANDGDFVIKTYDKTQPTFFKEYKAKVTFGTFEVTGAGYRGGSVPRRTITVLKPSEYPVVPVVTPTPTPTPTAAATPSASPTPTAAATPSASPTPVASIATGVKNSYLATTASTSGAVKVGIKSVTAKVSQPLAKPLLISVPASSSTSNILMTIKMPNGKLATVLKVASQKNKTTNAPAIKFAKRGVYTVTVKIGTQKRTLIITVK